MCTAISLFLKEKGGCEGGGGGDETVSISWGLEENEVSSACLSCHVCVACMVGCI